MLSRNSWKPVLLKACVSSPKGKHCPIIVFLVILANKMFKLWLIEHDAQVSLGNSLSCLFSTKQIEILLFIFYKWQIGIVGEFSRRAPIFRNAAQQIDPGVSWFILKFTIGNSPAKVGVFLHACKFFLLKNLIHLSHLSSRPSAAHGEISRLRSRWQRAKGRSRWQRGPM